MMPAATCTVFTGGGLLCGMLIEFDAVIFYPKGRACKRVRRAALQKCKGPVSQIDGVPLLKKRL